MSNVFKELSKVNVNEHTEANVSSHTYHGIGLGLK
jgi:hypothetical protein